MKKLKEIIKFIVGWYSEYTKREMAIFTRVVLILLFFNIPMFIVLYITHMKAGLSYRIMKMFWQYYLDFCKILITGYAVTFIGQMGKAFLSKREEEANKLKEKLGKLKKDGDGE